MSLLRLKYISIPEEIEQVFLDADHEQIQAWMARTLDSDTIQDVFEETN